MSSRASAALASGMLLCIIGAILVKHLIRIVPSSKFERPKVICKPWMVVTKPCLCTTAGYEMTDVSYTYLLGGEGGVVFAVWGERGLRVIEWNEIEIEAEWKKDNVGMVG